MTAAEWSTTGIPLPDERPETLLIADAALDWIAVHTTLKIAEPQMLPSGAKLFVLKYIGIMKRETGVTSESLAGISQTFDSSETGVQLTQLARELLGAYMKSDVRFVSAKGRWQLCR